MPEKLNILYIHCHDAGRYLQPYGLPVQTPGLQAFASESTVFRRAFCNSPTCSPSRACLLTGQYAHQNGMIGLNHRGFHLKDYRHHLGYFLKEKGYTTVLSGIQHELSPLTEKVYDQILEGTPGVTPGKMEFDEKTASNAAYWLSSNEGKDPFFMSCGFFFPHRPFPDSGDKIQPEYVKVPDPLPDTMETRKDMADYMVAVGMMDACFGRVIKSLKESRHADNTIVIFTVDHGIAFPFMKCNLTDSGMGVALIMDFPGNPMRGKTIDKPVSHIDLFPTLCELIKAEPPERLKGRSLLPLFDHPEADTPDIFAEVTYHAGYEPMRCIRSDRYKLIQRFGQDLRINPVNIDAGLSKTVLSGLGVLEKIEDRIQLYDLMMDPNERNNLAVKSEHQGILMELKGKLTAWMESTEDPLLNGPVPLPEGGVMNLRQAIDPSPKTEHVVKGPLIPESGGNDT